MPHYQDGTRAKITDEVVCEGADGVTRSGVVVNVIESSSCNLTVAVARPFSAMRYNPATGDWQPFYSFPVLEHLTFTARSCERQDLRSKRIVEERARKREELAGEVLELFREPEAEEFQDPGFDVHGELGG